MAQHDLNFRVERAESVLIDRIATRAYAMTRRATRRRPVRTIMDFVMDVTAVHANGCPLRLEELHAADDFNFAHDVFGIERHLDRETGQLGSCFVPRFARPQVADAASLATA